ncbi:MAG: DUF4278 domain-containing protein [Elainella sp. C42_A2020_010]|nr:DUF4278 domain-containing protein [Elainella sp. C42_A2020_010]
MQLTYRGSQYNSDVHAEVIPSSEIIARYRGIPYSLTRPANPSTALNCQLRFMGVSYRKTLFYSK